MIIRMYAPDQPVLP